MSFKVELMSYDGREDEIMQEEEVEQEDIDPREELEQQDPGDSRKLFLKSESLSSFISAQRMAIYSLTDVFTSRSDQELGSKPFSQ